MVTLPCVPNWMSRVKAAPSKEARSNLVEALELFFQTADASEVQKLLQREVFITHLEVAVG